MLPILAKGDLKDVLPLELAGVPPIAFYEESSEVRFTLVKSTMKKTLEVEASN